MNKERLEQLKNHYLDEKRKLATQANPVREEFEHIYTKSASIEGYWEALETSRPYKIELYFESENGCPASGLRWLERLKDLEFKNEEAGDELIGARVTKFKMHNGECVLSIEDNIVFK